MPNCIIFEATDGKKAIKLYKKQKLDVILMDIKCLRKMALKLLLLRKLGRSGVTPTLTAGILIEEKEK
jgi:CheY-like chemotaxis protein